MTLLGKGQNFHRKRAQKPKNYDSRHYMSLFFIPNWLNLYYPRKVERLCRWFMVMVGINIPKTQFVDLSGNVVFEFLCVQAFDLVVRCSRRAKDGNTPFLPLFRQSSIFASEFSHSGRRHNVLQCVSLTFGSFVWDRGKIHEGPHFVQDFVTTATGKA